MSHSLYDANRFAIFNGGIIFRKTSSQLFAERLLLIPNRILNGETYTPIKAPISGHIGKSNITVGAMATAYQPTPLAVIQQPNPIYVDQALRHRPLVRAHVGADVDDRGSSPQFKHPVPELSRFIPSKQQRQ